MHTINETNKVSILPLWLFFLEHIVIENIECHTYEFQRMECANARKTVSFISLNNKNNKMDNVKALVSKKKKRFIDEEHGFNLDLTYIGGKLFLFAFFLIFDKFETHLIAADGVEYHGWHR